MLAPDHRRRNGWILWAAVVAFLLVLAIVLLAGAAR